MEIGKKKILIVLLYQVVGIFGGILHNIKCIFSYFVIYCKRTNFSIIYSTYDVTGIREKKKYRLNKKPSVPTNTTESATYKWVITVYQLRSTG